VKKLLLFLLILSCSRENKRGVPFWHAMGGPLGDVLDEIIEDFNREFPGEPIISVKMGNYATLSQKIMGAVAAGKPPVMAQVYESWTSELLSAHKIVPIENYIRGEEGIPDSVLSDIFEIFRLDNQWDGIFVTFPFNKSVPVFYYNLDLFEKYGIDHFPRTWDEFRTVAKKLTVDTDGDGEPDIYGTAFPVEVWIFATILYQKGGRLIEGNRALFNGTEGIEAMNFLLDLLYKDKCAYLTTGYRHQDDFATGKVAMVWGTIVSYGFIKNKINFRLGVAPVPHDRDSIVIIAGTNVALFSDVPEEKRRRAFEFLKYFLRPEVQAKWSIGTGYLPLRRSVLNHPEMKKFFGEVPGMERAMRQVEYASFEPRTPAWFTGRRYLSTEGIEPALRKVLTPEKALERASLLINQELLRIELRKDRGKF
jgi:multiple sugar transport system substrate-binding protein